MSTTTEPEDWGSAVEFLPEQVRMNSCPCCGNTKIGVYIDSVTDVFVGCSVCWYRTVGYPAGYDTLAIVDWNKNTRNYFMTTEILPNAGNFHGMGNLWGAALQLNRKAFTGTCNGVQINSIELKGSLMHMTVNMTLQLADGTSKDVPTAQLKNVIHSKDNNTFVLPALQDDDIFDSKAIAEMLTVSFKDITQ